MHAHEIFWHCETKNFRRKNVIPPFSSIKHFETTNFLQNSRIPLRKVSALWDKRISTETCDKPPLIHKFVSKTEIFSWTEWFFYKIFRFGPVRQKISNKTVTPRPRLCMKTFDKRNFLKHQSFLQWNFLVQWDKNFDGKSWYPPPLIHKKNFQSSSFLKHNTQWFPVEIFSVLWDKKNFDKMVKLPPSFAWNSSIPEFFRNTERFSDGFYRHCETNIFQRRWLISPSYA